MLTSRTDTDSETEHWKSSIWLKNRSEFYHWNWKSLLKTITHTSLLALLLPIHQPPLVDHSRDAGKIKKQRYTKLRVCLHIRLWCTKTKLLFLHSSHYLSSPLIGDENSQCVFLQPLLSLPFKMLQSVRTYWCTFPAGFFTTASYWHLLVFTMCIRAACSHLASTCSITAFVRYIYSTGNGLNIFTMYACMMTCCNFC